MAGSKANRSKTICPVCSLQDGLVLQWQPSSPRFTEESPLCVDYDVENPINEGSLCPRGNSIAELVDHPRRLTCPQVGGRDVPWQEALSQSAKSLKGLVKKHGSEALGVLVGGGLTLEEALGVGKLARDVLGTQNVAALFPEDGAVFHYLAQLGWDDGFSLKDLQERQVMVLVGDVFMEHPVISKRILRAKYKDRQNRLFVIDSQATQTAGFAHQHLQPLPGTEALVLAGLAQMLSASAQKKPGEFPLKLDLAVVAQATGVSQEQMAEAASALNSAKDGVLIQSNLFGRLGQPGACAFLGHILTRLAPGKFTFLHLPIFWNGRGVHQVLSSNGKGQKAVSGPHILESIIEGKIKGLLLFGLDPLSATPTDKLAKAMKKLDFLLVTDVFPTGSTELADVLLPAAIGPEKGGQVLYLNGDGQEFQPVVPAPGLARPEMDIVASLAQRLSPDTKLSITPQGVKEKLSKSGGIPWGKILPEVESRLTQQLAAEKGKDTAYPLYLVSAAVPAHLGDGSLTRNFSWAHRVCQAPCIWAHPSLLEKLQLKQGDQVQVSSKMGQAVFPMCVNHSMSDNMISAPAHFPEVRRLFSWNLDPQSGELEPGPERVMLSKPKESS
jgi:anaerobic selenocysteine-containing dehydrogenase